MDSFLTLQKKIDLYVRESKMLDVRLICKIVPSRN